MFYPSILAHVINGVLLVIALVYGQSSFAKLRSLDPYHILILLVLFSIAIGIHGISHLGLEKEYQYLAPLYSENPHQGKKEKHGGMGADCPCMENFETCMGPCGGLGCGCRKNCPFMKTA